jgi:hypothetical protein
MADSEQKNFIDFVDPSFGDTGEDSVAAIQPITDGEGASQTTFRRPSENLRHRTEVVRNQLRNLQYYRDFNNWVIEGEDGHSIEWGGVVAGGGNGEITQVGDITIRPFLTPASSTKGSLKIGNTGTNAVDYEVQAGAYASDGVDQIIVEHRDGGAGTTLSVEISEGPIKRIVVFFNSGNTSHDSDAVVTAVNAAIASDTFLNGKLSASDDGAAGNAIEEQAPTRIEGTADQEAHVINAGTLDTFTAANPLAEGDTLAIWYRYLVEPESGFAGDPKGGVAGGRWESNPDRGTATIPSGSLFITSQEPSKIPGAVPVCKVINDALVFVDGSRFTKEVATEFGSSMVIDDSDFSGNPTNTSGGGIPPLDEPLIQDAFEKVDSRLGRLRAFTYVVTNGSTSTGGDFDGPTALQDAIAALSGTGGTLFVRRGQYSLGSSLTVPHNVTIVGEQQTTTDLRLTAGPGALSLNLNATLQNLTVSSAGGNNTVVTAGNRVTISNVTLSAITELTINHNLCSVHNLRALNSLVTDLVFTTNATGSVINNVSGAIKEIKLNGIKTHVYNVSASKVSVTPALSFPMFSTVEHCNIGTSNEDITILDVQASGSVVFKDCAFFNNENTATETAIVIDHEEATVRFDNCVFMGETQGTFFGIGDTSKDGVIFNNCSASLDCEVGIDTGANTVMIWNDSFITDEQATDVLLVSGAEINNSKRCEFHNCEFQLSRTTNARSINVTSYSFNDCHFKMSTATGEFAGTNSGRNVAFILFSSCQVDNCVFNMSSQPVEEDGDDNPTFTGNNGFVFDAIGGTYRNCKVINLNLYMKTTTGGVEPGLVHFSSVLAFASYNEVATVVDNLGFLFDLSAPSGSGTGEIASLIRTAGTSAIVTVKNCNFDILNELEPLIKFWLQGAGKRIELFNNTIQKIVPLRALTTDALSVKNNYFASSTPRTISLDGAADSVVVSNNTIIAKNADPSAEEIFFIPSPASKLIISNNTIIQDGTGALGPVFEFGSAPGAGAFISVTGNVIKNEDATGTAEIFSHEPTNYIVTSNAFVSSDGTYANTNLTGSGGSKVVANNVVS